MHNQDGTEYAGDLMEEIKRVLREATRLARSGPAFRASACWIDPGIGFGKTADHNWEVMRRLPSCAELGQPILIGTSRKSFIGKLLDLPVTERVEGTAATVAAAILRRRRRRARARRARDDARGGPQWPIDIVRVTTIAYLGLGSNLGRRARNLSAARRRLRQKGARILRQSRVIETEPWGVLDQPRFLNQVLEVDWDGTARQLLRAAKAVEREGGRVRDAALGPARRSTSTSCCSATRPSPNAASRCPTRASANAAFVLEGLERAGTLEGLVDPAEQLLETRPRGRAQRRQQLVAQPQQGVGRAARCRSRPPSP